MFRRLLLYLFEYRVPITRFMQNDWKRLNFQVLNMLLRGSANWQGEGRRAKHLAVDRLVRALNG